MQNDDTLKLLRECDAGTKTAVNSLKEVQDNIKNKDFLKLISVSIMEHDVIIKDIKEVLDEIGDEGKDQSAMAKAMSWMKINMKLSMDYSDKTIASLMIDGCNMGVKQLTGYIHEYTKASPRAVELANRLIKTEERLSDSLKEYL